MWLRALLKNNGREVLEAADGKAACELLETADIRIVITDWMMPGMDGLSLIEWIRSRDKGGYIYTILMTGRNQERDCVEGFSVGADDYVTKPVAPAILYARLGVADRILRIQEELTMQQARLRESRDLATRAYDVVQEELEDAAAVQKSRLPSEGLFSRSISSAWCYRPAMGISGDYLDIFQIDENRLVFYLLDVSGHGVTAALRSSAISQLLRPISGMMDGLAAHGPAHVIERLNRYLCKGNQDMDYFATIVMGELDSVTGKLRLVSAGHPRPLLLRDGEPIMEIDGGELPLGIDAGVSYNHEVIWLRPSDSLLLFSDGLLDCENRMGQRFGIGSLKRSVGKYVGFNLTEMLSKLENELDKWRSGADLMDDLSLLLLRFNPVRQHSPHAARSAILCQNE
jgi:sigma-B regulation protein RsbU (phosphoserine phosphatase)